MAQQIPCDQCKAEPAQLLQTNLSDGETVGIGASCLRSFITAFCEVITGHDHGAPHAPKRASVAAADASEQRYPAAEAAAEPPPGPAPGKTPARPAKRQGAR